MLLGLANNHIPVRMVINTGPGVVQLLGRLREDIQQRGALEEYVVMVKFTTDAVRAYRSSFQGAATQRVHVGAPSDFRSWVQGRLGPLAGIPETSFVRRLTEPLLLLNAAPEPRERSRRVGDYKGSRIEGSFVRGQDGVQVVETLLASAYASTGSVTNVEKDESYQKAGIDLLVKVAPESKPITTDVKAEKYCENLSLEDSSRLFKEDSPEYAASLAMPPWECKRASCVAKHGHRVIGTRGWFHTSQMDVLSTLFVPTGELFFIDFEELKAWALANEKSLEHKDGGAPGQEYQSHIWLAPVNRLLTELTGIVRVRISDWLPTLYAGAFKDATNVQDHLLRRTLRPQQPRFAVMPD
ncbi:hypothetical protein [Burkholderia ubonensis]|nr:hypothetical protein [Burkholderia ubonensis]